MLMTKKAAFTKDISKSFVFQFQNMAGQTDNGWNIFNLDAEMERQGVTATNMFVKSSLNKTFVFSPTYPAHFMVPKGLDEETLTGCKKFRATGRMPVLVYMHKVPPPAPAAEKVLTPTCALLSAPPLAESGYACMLRSSQPLTGIRMSKNAADEAVLKAANIKVIIDARPKVNAIANCAKGGGYESADAYGCKLEFLDIENIHVMRDSLKQVFAYAREAYLTNVAAVKAGDVNEKVDFHAQIGQSQWLKHVRQVLAGASLVANCMHNGKGCLVHCSDGWDRTPQLTALSQLLLDPFYRTTRGFAVLVEKEWVAYGHKFEDRYGHCSKDAGDGERSPIFVQFLDCVYQLQQQFPLAFEFNDRFLAYLFKHLFSCKYGTFVFNTEKERVSSHAHTRTTSIWTGIHKYSFFRNSLYAPAKWAGVLVPLLDLRAYSLWPVYYRWDWRYLWKFGIDQEVRQLVHDSNALAKATALKQQPNKQLIAHLEQEALYYRHGLDKLRQELEAKDKRVEDLEQMVQRLLKEKEEYTATAAAAAVSKAAVPARAALAPVAAVPAPVQRGGYVRTRADSEIPPPPSSPLPAE